LEGEVEAAATFFQTGNLSERGLRIFRIGDPVPSPTKKRSPFLQAGGASALSGAYLSLLTAGLHFLNNVKIGDSQ